MTDNELLRGNPIKTSEEDLLDRGNLVNHLSDLITRDSIKDCCTIGIIGKWGSGKSSVINLIEEKVTNMTDAQENTFFIRFNPIDYSTDAKGISKIFFGALIQRLKEIHKDHPELVSNYKRNRKRIFKHSTDIIANATKVVPDIPGIIDNIECLAKAIADPAESEPIETVKDKISKMLYDSKLKLIIIIDDLDRLDAGEATQILKLLRVTANFQNVFYVLAYDEDILQNLINERFGHDYLNKFIQVPVRLPKVNKSSIQQILYNWFIGSIKEYGIEPIEYTITACKSIHLSTMRDLYLLMNTFCIKFRMCYRDVSPEDMLALTFIEIKDPQLYDWIYENRLLLCNTGKTFVHNKGPQGFNSPIDASIVKPKMKNGTEAALEFLYPHLFKSYSMVDTEGLRKEQIRFRQYCSIYFLLKVPPTAISNVIIDRILESDRTQAFCEILTELIKIDLTLYDSFLEKILERYDEFEYLDKELIARALLFDEKLVDPALAELFPLENNFHTSIKETLLDLIFKELIDKDIETIFQNNLPDDQPYALALDYIYLHALFVESKRGRELPMSQNCLELIKKITGSKLCDSAPYFKSDYNARTMRTFFSFLSTINVDVTKREFGRIFDTDESIIAFIEENFDDLQLRAFEKDVVEEFSKFIPDQRLESLVNHPGKYQNIFRRIQNKEY